MTDAKHARLLLKVTLRNIEPPIWRRIAVAEDVTLAQLHRVIQEAFGWEDCHLHEFETATRTPDVRLLPRRGTTPDAESPRRRMSAFARMLADPRGECRLVHVSGGDGEHCQYA